MKSLWLWIVGIIVAVWIFSGEKNGSSSTTTTYNPPSQLYYQPQSAYQQPVVPTYSSPTFMGYSCTDDCSGHEAGYNWAEENGIDDPDDCGGNSDSFIEGCQAYAEEQQVAAEETTDDE
jgi:hypothetical protein